MKLFFLITAVIVSCFCVFDLVKLWHANGSAILIAMSDTAILLFAGKLIDYIWADR